VSVCGEVRGEIGDFAVVAPERRNDGGQSVERGRVVDSASAAPEESLWFIPVSVQAHGECPVHASTTQTRCGVRVFLVSGSVHALIVGLSSGVSAGTNLCRAPVSAQAGTTQHGSRTSGYSFMIDGKRTYLWSGRVPYSAAEPGLGRRRLGEDGARIQRGLPLLRLGLSSSASPGFNDFTGAVRDVAKLRDSADEWGIYGHRRPVRKSSDRVTAAASRAGCRRRRENTRSDNPITFIVPDEWQTQIDPDPRAPTMCSWRQRHGFGHRVPS